MFYKKETMLKKGAWLVCGAACVVVILLSATTTSNRRRPAVLLRDAFAAQSFTRQQSLTYDPLVAEYNYNYENNPDSDQFAPLESCPWCFSTGQSLPSAASRRIQAQRMLRQQGKRGRQQMLEEVSDFPDIEDDEEIKEQRNSVNKLFRAFEPVSEQMNKLSKAEKQDYAGFYRAYSAYQLPHPLSVGGPWQPEIESLGDDLPPYLYPYSEAYYPNGGTTKPTVTINANGPFSTNSFHVTGPQSINVQIGARGGEGEGADSSYIYPDGKHAVKTTSPQTVAKEVVGRPVVDGYEGGGEVKATCDPSNPDCGFWQDVYDDAFY
uniref:Uncharacterized protein n=1 Tax=Hanusia phi TaxID=3032 RepID=A0A7S0F0U8_9CRYP|mmetsp:Transcript_34835/g.78714  ORF Transcript_34835/g.78714 Transcript_34835/m.78714 type:complete len:322 (+) Transcript_34835:220-1185(+)